MHIPGSSDIVERSRCRRRKVDAVIRRDRERQGRKRNLTHIRFIPVLGRRERHYVFEPAFRAFVHIILEEHRIAADYAVGAFVDRIPLNYAPDDLPVDHGLGHRTRKDTVIALEPDVRQILDLVRTRIVTPDLSNRERTVHAAEIVREDGTADIPVVHLAEIARILPGNVMHVKVAVFGKTVEAHVLRIHHHPKKTEMSADLTQHLHLVELRVVAIPERAEIT